MHVTLFLNHQCNLRCTYCYNGHKFNRPMPDGILQRAVEMAFDTGIPRLAFFGGEPLLEFERMTRAIDYAHKLANEKEIQEIRFSTTTNGTLLDPSRLRLLRDERFHLVISIDGCQEAHEATRSFANGESSYNVVVRNVERALEEIPSLETISVIDPANVEFASQSLEALMAIGVRNLNFTINYEAEWSDHQLEILGTALDNLSDLYVSYYRDGTDFSLDLFDSKIITHLKGGYSCKDQCKFGKNELCVSPSGKLYPCERLVGDDTRDDIIIGDVETGLDIAKISAIKKGKDTSDPDCKDCKLNHRCMFWCGCVNYATTGNVGKTSGLVCQLEQMIIRSADKAASTLFQEKNPLFIDKFYAIA